MLARAFVCPNTLAILTKDADPNVSSTVTVLRTKLVLTRNVGTLVLARAGKTLIARLSTIYRRVPASLVLRAILSDIVIEFLLKKVS